MSNDVLSACVAVLLIWLCLTGCGSQRYTVNCGTVRCERATVKVHTNGDDTAVICDWPDGEQAIFWSTGDCYEQRESASGLVGMDEGE